MNMENLYLDRASLRIAKYDVLEIKNGGEILVLKDTTCRDHENYIIEVQKVDDHYEYMNAVNESAKEYVYFHMGKFFESELLCAKYTILDSKEYVIKKIESINQTIKNLKSKQTGKRKVRYAKSEKLDFGYNVWFESLGMAELAAKLELKDGSKGYLLNQYDEYYEDDDCYESKRKPNIAIFDNDILTVKMYDDEYKAYLDHDSYKESERRKENERNIKTISKLESDIKYYENRLNIYDESISMIDSGNYSYNDFFRIYIEMISNHSIL